MAEPGTAVVLMDPRSGIAPGLHHHDGNPGEAFDQSRAENSGAIDTSDPVPYSAVVFRDDAGVVHPGHPGLLPGRSTAAPW